MPTGKIKGAIGGLVKKIKDKKEAKLREKLGSNAEFAKKEKSDLFESNFVKQIIETFENVMHIIETEEKEMN